jgi:hypothetical protein
MSNNYEVQVTVEECTEDDEYDPDDFGFVVGADGNLKSCMIPEHLMDDPPEEVKIILELFGIDNIHDLGQKTLH